MDNFVNIEFIWPNLSVTQYIMVTVACVMFLYLLMKFVSYRQVVKVHCRSFAVFDSRLESFKKCYMELNQDILALCESGLYYTGDGYSDKTTCFSCGIDLFKWEKYDNPWVEHALWSGSCSYLKLAKGKTFVECVHVHNKKANDILKNAKKTVKSDFL